MGLTRLKTERLELVLPTVEEVLAGIDEMSAADKEQVSQEWLELMRNTPHSDPWIHGFTVKLQGEDVTVGQCGFKGPPTTESVVEIAYAIFPDYQRRGYATEAAQALVSFAFESGRVRLVLAHTLPEESASTRVLTKCGFENVGEAMDPDDGLVWRWEKQKPSQMI